MSHDETNRSQERVQALASAVSLPLEKGRIPALAETLDAALEMIERLDAPGIDGGDAMVTPYDPAWPVVPEARR